MQINNSYREISTIFATIATDRDSVRIIFTIRCLTVWICIFNPFWGYLWGIFQFDTSHMRRRDHEPQNCKSKIRIHFFLRALLRSGLYVCRCVYVCAKTKPQVLDVVRGAEISNAGHVDAKTPP